MRTPLSKPLTHVTSWMALAALQRGRTPTYQTEHRQKPLSVTSDACVPAHVTTTMWRPQRGLPRDMEKLLPQPQTRTHRKGRQHAPGLRAGSSATRRVAKHRHTSLQASSTKIADFGFLRANFSRRNYDSSNFSPTRATNVTMSLLVFSSPGDVIETSSECADLCPSL